ncbi:hypothetical protein D3C75_1136200 [compost metagenome]
MKNGLVQLLNETDRFQILKPAVPVAPVLVVLLLKIETEHACNRIHTHSVNVINIEPEQRI